MSKRKTKKDLEAEILELKRDIRNLVSKDVSPIDKATTRLKWNVIIQAEDFIWSGKPIRITGDYKEKDIIKFDGILHKIINRT